MQLLLQRLLHLCVKVRAPRAHLLRWSKSDARLGHSRNAFKVSLRHNWSDFSVRFLEFGILSSSLRHTAAPTSGGKLSISQVEIMHARLAAAWSVQNSGLASPTMTDQPTEEDGRMETFSDLGRLFESREVGRDANSCLWLYELMVAV